MWKVPINLAGAALALFLMSLAAAPSLAAAAPAAPTTIVDLGTLGGSYSEARAVNQRGQVVGDSLPADSTLPHAFLWEGGRMRDLGTLGGPESSATDIDDRGRVVGWSRINADPSVIHAFLWEGGRMRDLGTLGGPESSATAINNHGQVVGSSQTAAGRTHAFIWASGRMRDLGIGEVSGAQDINRRGQITGYYYAGPGGAHAYRVDRAGLGALLPLGGQSSVGVAINGRGQVAVEASAPPFGTTHAFLWSNGDLRDLGTLGGSFSVPRGIDRLGGVVGYADAPQGGLRGFLWRGGVMTDLGVLVEHGLNGSRANDINDHGLIVGGSDVASGGFHAVVWR
jgi:probable HAF family extracellular repeat protein